jgi:hypothetical protein
MMQCPTGPFRISVGVLRSSMFTAWRLEQAQKWLLLWVLGYIKQGQFLRMCRVQKIGVLYLTGQERAKSSWRCGIWKVSSLVSSDIYENHGSKQAGLDSFF